MVAYKLKISLLTLDNHLRAVRAEHGNLWRAAYRLGLNDKAGTPSHKSAGPGA